MPQRPLNLLPLSPDQVHTTFFLYTRANPAKGQALDARHPDQFSSIWPSYSANKQTKIIVHGFLDNVELNADWLKEMATEFLANGDYNAIVTDWHHGNLPPYTQATGNTRLVGAQIADLIKTIMSATKQSPADFHVIGHSLGAHIAGYAGERVPGLGRITGLDPAGPYFEDTDIKVRLDPTDAVFVDTIHSDASPFLTVGLGLKQALGHADYYPNGGHDQPGCTHGPVTQILENGIIHGTGEFVACDHLRSYKFFTESINSRCPFMAFPCNKEEDFTNGRCQSCSSSNECGRMGFYANETVPSRPTKYFLSTSDHAPFCQFHMKIEVFLHSSHTAERGTMKARLYGDKGSSAWIQLNDDPKQFQPGDIHDFVIGLPSDIGHVTAVDITWHHNADILDPFKWNPLGLRHPSLRLSEVDTTLMETSEKNRFCANGRTVETDKSMHITTLCSN